MAIENCKRCNRVFRKAHSPLCPECFQQDMEAFEKVYRFLGQQGTESYIHLEEVAEQCKVSLRDVEDMFFNGRFGLAGTHIAFNCQICDVPITRHNADKKRLCPRCAVTVEVEGKLHTPEEEVVAEKPKRLPTPSRTDKEYQEALEQKVAKEKAQPPSSSRRFSDEHQYGFKRISHE